MRFVVKTPDGTFEEAVLKALADAEIEANVVRSAPLPEDIRERIERLRPESEEGKATRDRALFTLTFCDGPPTDVPAWVKVVLG